RVAEALARGAHLWAFDVDPVTRVAGALAFHSVVDLDQRRVVDARTEATLFRGYELILQGRDPLDAIHISSRACGGCGGGPPAPPGRGGGLWASPPRRWPSSPATWARGPSCSTTIPSTCSCWPGPTTPRPLSAGPARRCGPRRSRPRRPAPPPSACAPWPTSCAASARSAANSTSRRCASPAPPARSPR